MSLYSSLEGAETEREMVQVRYNELAGSPFVNIKIIRELSETVKFYTLTVSGHLKSCQGRYHVSHTCTLKKTSRTCVGVHASYVTGNRIK